MVSKQVLLFVPWLLAQPSNARACECPDTSSAIVEWPRLDAIDVATDTPVVVATYNATTPESAVRLVGEDGDAVPVTQVLRLPAPWKGCGSAERLFLRPSRLLHSGIRYMVSFTGTTRANHINSSFTVGDQLFAAEGPIHADVHYLSNYTDASCTGAHCSMLATIGVDLGTVPMLPRLLVIESAASAGRQNEGMFWPMAVDVNLDTSSRHAAQLGVALPPDDDCVMIRVYGLEGHPLFEEQRCAPDRCVIGANTAVSTCGAPAQAAVDISRVAADSCRHPGGLIQDPGEDAGVRLGGEARPESAATNGDTKLRSTAAPQPSSGAQPAVRGGCGVTARDPAASGPALMFIAGWMLLARRLRRCKTC